VTFAVERFKVLLRSGEFPVRIVKGGGHDVKPPEEVASETVARPVGRFAMSPLGAGCRPRRGSAPADLGGGPPLSVCGFPGRLMTLPTPRSTPQRQTRPAPPGQG
jgi:hypothetical protein